VFTACVTSECGASNLKTVGTSLAARQALCSKNYHVCSGMVMNINVLKSIAVHTVVTLSCIYLWQMRFNRTLLLLNCLGTFTGRNSLKYGSIRREVHKVMKKPLKHGAGTRETPCIRHIHVFLWNNSRIISELPRNKTLPHPFVSHMSCYLVIFYFESHERTSLSSWV
jgi:hypothetical protein